jgi:Mn-dependent DtxR family transcriptional regulator
MTVEEIQKFATLYQIAKILGVSPPSCYKWKETNKIPDLRLYQLKEKRPEWFTSHQRS